MAAAAHNGPGREAALSSGMVYAYKNTELSELNAQHWNLE
jgi:hypothetical protein